MSNNNNGLNDLELLRLIQQEFQQENHLFMIKLVSNILQLVMTKRQLQEIHHLKQLMSPHYHNNKKRKSRWKYCCQQCTKSDKGSIKPKTCVCIVPASQRRIQIGEQGCLSCHCTGCSIEDEKKNKNKKKRKSSSDSSSDDSSDFKTVNGCCKKCMKAFSKKGKKLKFRYYSIYIVMFMPGSKGCQKETSSSSWLSVLRMSWMQSRGQEKEKPKNSRQLSPVSSDLNEQNLNNFQNAPLIQLLNSQNINPGILGIGIPQRTYSYIYGKEQGR